LFFHVACTRAHIIGEHPFGAKRQIASRLFLKIFEIFLRGQWASMIRPEKTEVKWHNFAVERRGRRLAAAGATGSAGV
jgi:hypothetical protein